MSNSNNNTNNNTRPHTIITHPGQAHRDDFVATCIALAAYPSVNAVYRREPTQQELQDPQVLILDVGGRHEPERLNFDHHQLPKDAEPACALTFLVRHLGVEGQFRLMDWFQSTEVMDSKGPAALAAHLGLASPDPIFRNLSPIEGALLELFGKEVELTTGSYEIMFLEELGARFLAHAKELQEQMQWLDSHCRAVDIEGVQALIIESANTKGSQKFRDSRYPDAGICVSHDDRGEGWSLYRFNDHPKVNFSLLEGKEQVSFAHKGGFIAKTGKRLGMDQVMALVKSAILPSWVLVLVVNAGRASVVDALRSGGVAALEGDQLYKATQALWLGTEADFQRSNLPEWFSETRGVSEPSEYDAYLVRVQLPSDDPGLHRNANQMDRLDAFRRFQSMGFKTTVSSRLPSDAYGTTGVYSR